MKTTHIRSLPSVLLCLLASVLILLAAAPAAHAQSVSSKLPPPPPKANFSNKATGDFLDKLDALIDELARAADQAVAARDTDIFHKTETSTDQKIDALGPQAEAILATLSADDKERFEQHVKTQGARKMALTFIVQLQFQEIEKDATTTSKRTYTDDNGLSITERIYKNKQGNETIDKTYTDQDGATVTETTEKLPDGTLQKSRSRTSDLSSAPARAKAAPAPNRPPRKLVSTEKNFPTPVYRHQALNDFIREFDAQVDEYIRLANEAIQTGDRDKLNDYVDETKLGNAGTPFDKVIPILKAVRATADENRVTSDYINDQQERMRNASSAARWPDDPHKPLPPPKTTAESIAKVAPPPPLVILVSIAEKIPPAPARPAPFNHAPANEVIDKMEAWANDFIAIADQAIAGDDYEKLRAYFTTLGKFHDGNWPALEGLSKTENARYPDYAQYSKAWGARMNAIWNTARAELSAAKK